VSPEFVHKVLNANIVFLCNKNDTNKDFTLDCFGLGKINFFETNSNFNINVYNFSE